MSTHSHSDQDSNQDSHTFGVLLWHNHQEGTQSWKKAFVRNGFYLQNRDIEKLKQNKYLVDMHGDFVRKFPVHAFVYSQDQAYQRFLKRYTRQLQKMGIFVIILLDDQVSNKILTEFPIMANWAQPLLLPDEMKDNFCSSIYQVLHVQEYVKYSNYG